jgi:hypothetical protein
LEKTLFLIPGKSPLIFSKLKERLFLFHEIGVKWGKMLKEE